MAVQYIIICPGTTHRWVAGTPRGVSGAAAPTRRHVRSFPRRDAHREMRASYPCIYVRDRHTKHRACVCNRISCAPTPFRSFKRLATRTNETTALTRELFRRYGAAFSLPRRNSMEKSILNEFSAHEYSAF